MTLGTRIRLAGNRAVIIFAEIEKGMQPYELASKNGFLGSLLKGNGRHQNHLKLLAGSASIFKLLYLKYPLTASLSIKAER